MNVLSWLKKTKKEIDSLDAELILAFVLEKDRTFLAAHDDYELDASEENAADELVYARKNHYPLAYLIGVKEFYGRNFSVNESVLIPRPETEAIIDIVKDLKPHKVLDVGTGSGCIALTIKAELPESEVVAIDAEQTVQAVFEENRENLGVDVKFVLNDLVDGFDIADFDCIVSNLPYVDSEWDWLSPELKFEPETALFAEDDGLNLIKKLINQVSTGDFHGHLILESDKSQHDNIKKYAEEKGFKYIKSVGFIQDFTL